MGRTHHSHAWHQASEMEYVTSSSAQCNPWCLAKHNGEPAIDGSENSMALPGQSSEEARENVPVPSLLPYYATVAESGVPALALSVTSKPTDLEWNHVILDPVWLPKKKCICAVKIIFSPWQSVNVALILPMQHGQETATKIKLVPENLSITLTSFVSLKHSTRLHKLTFLLIYFNPISVP